ncbi:hypothetical protein [Microtetraspora malaysiensis]|uniref:hypothetical protein n=1 Tax=Microtetraspora malaysiensis TaxID=161358 RepID=UPI000B017DB8|nr:hypothetical protein [Microtetraspora malaysiensis]
MSAAKVASEGSDHIDLSAQQDHEGKDLLDLRWWTIPALRTTHDLILPQAWQTC